MKSPPQVYSQINFRKKLRIWKLIPLKLRMSEFPLERLHVPQFEDLDCSTKVMSFKTIVSAMNC